VGDICKVALNMYYKGGLVIVRSHQKVKQNGSK